MTLLKEYYSVAMSIVGIPCQWLLEILCLTLYVGFIRCAFSLFSSFTLFFGSLSVVRVSIS